MSRLVWLSSATSTRTPSSATGVKGRATAERATGRRRSTMNFAPLPGALST